MNIQDMTNEQRWALGYMEGYRIGRITSVRETLISCVNMEGKGNNAPSRKLIQKINRETDRRVLLKMVLLLLSRELSVEELEAYFDMVFLTKEELLAEVGRIK